jgi:hypothetical protein
MKELAEGAAMFAVVTDAYASRAWCREELRRFREPRRDPTSRRWWLRPVFILDNLSGEATRSMFEVGSAPAARWNPARADQLVDELVREMLMAEMNRERAARFPERAGTHVINWLPDTWTLLHILRTAAEEDRNIAYPGDGLPSVEADRLSSMLPGVTLASFEEFHTKPDRPVAPPSQRGDGPRATILLSISDPPAEDLALRGLHRSHLDDAAVRIARALLNEGFDVMYGGRAREGFTEGFQDNSAAVVVEPRLINHVGWPHSRQLTATQVADSFGVTRYVRVEWDKGANADEKDPWNIALAASHTRREAISPGLRDVDDRDVVPPVALIALGGQVSGFAGFLPGVAEEVAVAIERRLAVFVLGGFGGAAEQVALEVLGQPAPQLSLDAFSRSESYGRLRRAAIVRGGEAELSTRATWLARTLHGADLCNGLSPDENRELLHTLDLGRAIRLIREGLAGLQSASPRAPRTG